MRSVTLSPLGNEDVEGLLGRLTTRAGHTRSLPRFWGAQTRWKYPDLSAWENGWF